MHEIIIPDWLKAHVKERRGTDAAHNAALENFHLSFGDVMTAAEAQGYLLVNAGGTAASA